MDIIYGPNHVRIRSEPLDIPTISTEIEDLMASLEEEMKTGNKDGIKLLRDVLDQKLSEAKVLIAKIDTGDDDSDASTDSDDQDVQDAGDVGVGGQKDSVTAAQAAADVIKGFQADRKAFSALNVTRAVQAQNIQVRHRHLKEVVHNAFSAGDMGDYLRELFRLPGMPIDANLYYPPEFDPNDYDGEAVSALDTAPDADDVDDDNAPVQDPVDTVDTGKFDVVRKMSQDGQLYLPKNLTAGITTPVASVATGGIVSVGEESDAPTDHVPLTRDAKGNVRLTRQKLRNLGVSNLSTAKKFGITETDGELTVESAD